MRKAWALFFVGLFAIQVFYSLGVYLYWVCNQQYIAQNLCVNKDRPNLHCDGKCYLKKKLAAQMGHNSTAPNPVKQVRSTFELSPFIVSTEKMILPRPDAVSLSFPGSTAIVATGFTGAVFHPPAGVC